jgi:hypothetical protein
MLTIAADPKHLGARIGITAVLHTGAKRRILADPASEFSRRQNGFASNFNWLYAV